MKDTAITASVVLAFATLVTAHVAILFGLVRRRHLAEGLGGFVLAPAAPWLALRRGMRAAPIAWLVSAAAYAVALVLAR
jgi:predicted DNA-binding transcriptional regulator